MARRRVVAALTAASVAAGAFAGGVVVAGGEPAEAEVAFVQTDLTAGEAGWEEAVASVYDDYGLPLACGGVLEEGQLGVASRTVPCGTTVAFAYRGRMVHVPVIDRGPYIDGREWDLTAATAEALRFPGLGTVMWRR